MRHTGGDTEYCVGDPVLEDGFPLAGVAAFLDQQDGKGLFVAQPLEIVDVTGAMGEGAESDTFGPLNSGPAGSSGVQPTTADEAGYDRAHFEQEDTGHLSEQPKPQSGGTALAWEELPLMPEQHSDSEVHPPGGC